MQEIFSQFQQEPSNEELFQQVVQEYKLQNNWSELLAAYEQHAQALSSSSPKKAASYYLQAAKLAKEKTASPERIIKLLQAVLGLDASSSEALQNLELSYIEQEKWHKLVELYQQRLHSSPAPAKKDWLLKIAQTLEHKLQKPQEAVEFYHQAWQQQPENLLLLEQIANLWLALGEKQKALQSFEFYLSKSQQEEEQDRIRLQMGEIAQELGQQEKAASYYRQIRHPLYRKDVHRRLERLFQDHPSNLVLVLTEKLKDSPEHKEKLRIYKQLAQLYEQLQQPQQALQIYQELAQLQGESISNIEKISELLWQQHKITEWFRYQHQKSKLIDKPEDKVYHWHRCAVELKSLPQQEEHVPKLIEIYEQILQISPEDRVAVDALTNLYRSLKKHEELLRILMHKLKYSSISEKVGIYFQIARLFSESLNQEQQAEDYYQKVIEIQGDHHETLRELKQQYRKRGNYSELVRLLADEIRFAPEKAEEKYYEIALIYRDFMDDLPQATEALEKALEQNSRFLPALSALREIYSQTGQEEKYIATAQKEIEALSKISEIVPLHFSIAELQLKSEQYQAAEEQLQKVLLLDPANPEALQKLAQLYQQQERWQDYIATLETNLNFNSSLHEIPARLLEISQVYQEKLHALEPAMEYLERAYQLSPQNQYLLEELTQVCERAEFFEKLIYCLQAQLKLVTDKAKAQELLLRIAEIYQQQQQFSQAIVYYEKALYKNPYSGKILRELAELYQQTEQLTKRFEVLERLLLSDQPPSDLPEAYSELANLAQNTLGKPQLAIDYWQKVYQLRPNETVIDHLLELYQTQGNWQQVAGLYEKKLAMIKNQQQAYSLLEQLGELYQENFPSLVKCKQVYQRMLVLKPDDSNTLHKLAEVCQELQDWESLVAVYQSQLALCSKEEEKVALYRQIAWTCHQKLADFPQAIEFYSKVQQAHPQDSQVLGLLKQLYERIFDYQHVLEIIDQQLHLEDDPEQQAQHLLEKAAIYRDKLGKIQKARQQLEQALDLYPTFVNAMDYLEGLLRHQQDFSKLIELLGQKAELLSDHEAAEIYLEIARIWQDELGNDAESEKFLLKSYHCHPQHKLTRKRLQAFYRHHHKWQELADLYQQERTYLQAPQQSAQVLFLEGKIYEQKLQLPAEAASLYVQALQFVPDFIPAIKSLQKIYLQNQKYSSLAEAYLAELAVSSISEQRRITLHQRCAQLFEQEADKTKAIEHYRQILQLAPHNLIAIQGLQQLYRQSQNYEKLTHVLLTELAITEKEQRLFSLHSQLAEIYLHQLPSANEAIKHLSKAYSYSQQDQQVSQKLQQVLQQQQRWLEYCKYAEEEIPHLSQRDKITRHLWLAEIYQQQLDHPQKAIEHLQAASAIESLDLTHLQQLQELYYTDETHYAPLLLECLEQELTQTKDSKRILHLHLEIARLARQPLKKIAQSIAHYQQVLELDPRNKKAYENLLQLYSQQGQWQELTNLLMHSVHLSSQQSFKKQQLAKIASIWEHKLHHPQRAMGVYQLVLSIEPHNLAAIRGIRRILEKEKDWHGTILYLEQEAQLLQARECASIYLKIARIWETKLQLIPQAVQAYIQVLKHHYHPATAEHASSLLRSTKNYRVLSQVIKKMILRTQNAKEKADKLSELGSILCELDNTSQALKVYRKALKYQPQSVTILNRLEKVYEQQQLWEKLAQTKEQKLPLLRTQTEIRRLHIELGKIYEERLYDEREAISHYEKALQISSEDTALLQILQRLYQNWGYFSRYIELCQEEISATTDVQRQLELWLATAHTWRDCLFELDAAIDSFEAVLRLDPTHQQALDALIDLYHKQHDYQNLIRIYQSKLATIAESEQEQQKDFCLKIGQLLLDKLDNNVAAQKYFERVLANFPENKTALAALEKIYQEGGVLEDQAKILQKKIALATTDEEKGKLLWQLAKLYHKSETSKDKAITTYQELRKFYPKDKQILRNLQQLFRQLGKEQQLSKINHELLGWEDDPLARGDLWLEIAKEQQSLEPVLAITTLKQAVEEAPEHSQCLDLLVQILQEQQRWSEVVEFQALQIKQEEKPRKKALLLYQQGKVYLDKLQQENQAIECFERSRQADVNYYPPLTELAQIFYQNCLWYKAYPLYEEIAQHHHNRPEVSLCQTYNALGYIARKSNRDDLAIVYLQKCLQQEGENYQALRLLGDIYYQNQQWEQALLIYMKLSNLSPEHPEDRQETNLRLAVIKDKMGMAEGAIEGYLNVSKENPEDVDTWEALGRLYYERDDLDQALECFQRVVELTNDSEQRKRALSWQAQSAEELGKLELAIELTQQLLAEQEESSNLQKLANLYIAQENWQQAQEYAEKTWQQAQDKPEQVAALSLLGEISRAQQQIEKAVSYYQQALELIPSQVSLVEKIAEIYASEENWEQVLATYQNFIPEFPDEMRIRLVPLLVSQAKILHEKLHQEQQAIEIYERIIEIVPDHEAAHVALANMWSKSEKDWDKAIPKHLYLLSRNPFRSNSYHQLFTIYSQQKKWDQAYLCAQALESLDKVHPEEQTFLEEAPTRVPSGWLDPWTLNNFVRESARDTLYEIMAEVDTYANRAYPPEIPEQWRLLREDKLEGDLAQEVYQLVTEVKNLLSIKELQVYLTEQGTISLENTQPPSIVIGEKFFGKLNRSQACFVLARSLFYISINHLMAKKLSASDYSFYVARLVEAFAETGTQPSEEEDSISRKLRYALPRRIRRQLEERMDILTEVYQADTATFLEMLARAANNIGLLVSNSLSDTLRAYYFEQGENFRRDKLTKDDYVREIFLFNISEEHVRLRRELGLEIKWIK